MAAMNGNEIGHHELVVVSNRLPLDVTVGADGSRTFSQSPGGLVTALEPVVRERRGAWVGWIGEPDLGVEPFDADGVRIVPVALDREDLERYYEGFSNDTLWPLYHDVIVPPTYHREWWDRYRAVNARFAAAAAAAAARHAVVWVHDYQLQLVPRMLRELRPDVTIGYFHHVPFPPSGIFAQLPWRTEIVEGLLGADVIGFQRTADAANYITAVRRLTTAATRQIPKGWEAVASLRSADGGAATPHRALVRAFPISIDVAEYERLAEDPAVMARAAEIRASFGADRKIVLGVDRLDYTKGIGHRIKAFGELLEDGVITVEDAVLIQIASPSRERVYAYQQLRDEVELMVGRINGAFQTIEHRAVSYHHHSYPREEMVAMYLAADIALVTPLRDGMNLVAKEYVASRIDGDGVLVLSEFTGAADELRKAVIVNPHDIAGLKEALVAAIRMPEAERRSRMRSLRRRLKENDVAHWARDFLDACTVARTPVVDVVTGEITLPRLEIPEELEAALREFAARPSVLVAVDFDGTIAPFSDDPDRSRMLGRARAALLALAAQPRTRVAVVSGRSLDSLGIVLDLPPEIVRVGSHGAELSVDGRLVAPAADRIDLTELDRLAAVLSAAADGLAGVWVERKPVGLALHTRTATLHVEARARDRALRGIEANGLADRVLLREGKRVLEFSLWASTKGDAIDEMRGALGVDAVFFAGDDVTDEDGFGALGPDDVPVKCGEGETLARFRVADPVEVARVLERLAELRSDVL